MKRPFLFSIAAFVLLSAFHTKKRSKLKLPEEFAYIPVGSYYTATPEEDPYYHGLTKTKQNRDSSKILSVGNFYMSKYEITNLQYRTFYNEVSVGMTDDEKEKIMCDSLGWRMAMTYCEPMVEYYYRHPAYNDYPVSNINYEGALQYCKALQQKIQKDNPDFIIEVKLPAKEEWIWAAMGGRAQAMFPWGNYYLRNKKGQLMCNFRAVGDGAIHRNRTTGKPEVAESYSGYAGSLSDKAFYTANVKSFYPNDYGLYNMCGNVAEMIAEENVCVGGSWNDYGGDVHIRSATGYQGAEPTVGFRPVIIAKEKEQK